MFARLRISRSPKEISFISGLAVCCGWNPEAYTKRIDILGLMVSSGDLSPRGSAVIMNEQQNVASMQHDVSVSAEALCLLKTNGDRHITEEVALDYPSIEHRLRNGHPSVLYMHVVGNLSIHITGENNF